MKKMILTFCLFLLGAVNILPQNLNGITVDSGYINVDNGKLFYEMAGKGENIVLIHDGNIHREIWDEQFPVFAKNYRVVRYDRREYGKSSDPISPFSNIEDLNQLFIQLKIDKAIVFGMSAGGALAIDFTLKYPQKVTGLVLAGAVVNGYGYSSHMLNRGGRIDLGVILLDPQKRIKYFGQDDPYTVYSENIKAKEKVWKLIQTRLLHQNHRGDLQRPPERIAVKFLSEIKVSTLILVGEFDIPDVHAHSGVIEAGIPNSKREIILKAGHLIPIEQPEVFNKTVLKFFKEKEFNNILNNNRADAAVEYFINARASDNEFLPFDERTMNTLAYKFLSENKVKEAVELFKLNTIAFPASANTFDSLAEAYLKDGQKDLAIKNYEKSLELNPANDNAKEVLKNLKK